MRFLAILSRASEASHRETAGRFRAESEAAGLEYLELEPETVDAGAIASLREGEGRSVLYRVTGGIPDVEQAAQWLEYLLWSPGVNALYRHRSDVILNGSKRGVYLRLREAGVDQPMTVAFPSPEPARGIAAVEGLGGFPVIVKELHGSRGRGVQLVASAEDYERVTETLVAENRPFLVQEYVPEASRTERLIVLGEEVLAGVRYASSDGGIISTQGGDEDLQPWRYPPEIERLAVRAVHALNLDFGGVDIVWTASRALVLEVNYPCYFASCERRTGVNIARQVVEYLVAKNPVEIS